MDYDLLFVVGFVVLILAIPAIISAITDGHAPRAAMLAIVIGVGLVAYVVTQVPGQYSIERIPEVFVRVAGQLLN